MQNENDRSILSTYETLRRERAQWDVYHRFMRESECFLLTRQPAPHFVGEVQHLNKLMQIKLTNPDVDVYHPKLSSQIARIFSEAQIYYHELLHDEQDRAHEELYELVIEHVTGMIDARIAMLRPYIIPIVNGLFEQPMQSIVCPNTGLPDSSVVGIQLGLPTIKVHLKAEQDLPLLVTDLNPGGDEYLEIQIGTHRMSGKRYDAWAGPRIQEDTRLPEPNRILSQVPITHARLLQDFLGQWYITLYCLTRRAPNTGVYRLRQPKLSLIAGTNGVWWHMDSHTGEHKHGYLKLWDNPYSPKAHGLFVLRTMIDSFRHVCVMQPATKKRNPRQWGYLKRWLLRLQSLGHAHITLLKTHDLRRLFKLGFYDAEDMQTKLCMVHELPIKYGIRPVESVEYWLTGHQYQHSIKLERQVLDKQFNRLND